jgi:hypothetical protein
VSDKVRHGEDSDCDKEDGNCEDSEAEKEDRNGEERTTGETG